MNNVFQYSLVFLLFIICIDLSAQAIPSTNADPKLIPVVSPTFIQKNNSDKSLLQYRDVRKGVENKDRIVKRKGFKKMSTEEKYAKRVAEAPKGKSVPQAKVPSQSIVK
jgi:hypothetical protein